MLEYCIDVRCAVVTRQHKRLHPSKAEISGNIRTYVFSPSDEGYTTFVVFSNHRRSRRPCSTSRRLWRLGFIESGPVLPRWFV